MHNSEIGGPYLQMVRADEGYGIGQIEWRVMRNELTEQTVVVGRYRGRDGLVWAATVELAGGLAGALPPLSLFGVIWRNFRRRLDRRYDNPFAFWPELQPGRWSSPATQ